MLRFVFQAVLAVVDPLAQDGRRIFCCDLKQQLLGEIHQVGQQLGNSWATDVCATLDWCCQIVWRNDSHGHDVYAVKPAN